MEKKSREYNKNNEHETDSSRIPKYQIPLPKVGARVGKREYWKKGEDYLQLFIKLCDLTPDSSILDVGCGVGRMAIPLTKYLSEKGSYDGFDIVPRWIEWCQKEITSRYPNFHFITADIYNGNYNPDGRVTASRYRFPYESGTFDLVFLTSVFTHMLPKDMENYLKEVARVLKIGARCLITFFLLNEEAESLIQAGLARKNRNFKHKGDGYKTYRQDRPESAIAYEEEYVRGLYRKFGLTIEEPIYYGSWCGRKKHLRGQDIVVAIK